MRFSSSASRPAPASVAILGATGKFIRAINPLAWLMVIRRLGVWYAGLLGYVLASTLLIGWLVTTPLWVSVKLTLTVFIILGVFNVIGAVLYERRHDLDFDVLRSPERDQERAQTERERLRARAIDDVYMQARARKYMGVAPAAADWLDACTREELQSDAPEFMRAALSWNDARALSALAPTCIIKLYDARLIPEALEAWEIALQADPEFRLLPADKAGALARLSGLAGKPALARKFSTTTESSP